MSCVRSLFLLAVSVFQMHGKPFAYDYAVVDAQKGDWHVALSQLQQVLTEKPTDASVLYDTGVASFHTGDIAHAITYFEQAAQRAVSDSALQEKAWINAGTAHATNTDFTRAVPCIESALALNPDNEAAQKKLEEFKKKRDEQNQEQQEQQEQKDDTSDSQKDENNDASENDEKSSDQNKSKSEQSKNNQDKEQKEESGSGDTKSGQDGAGDEQRDQSPESSQQQDGSDKKNQNRSSDAEKDADNSGKDKKGSAPEKTGKNEREQQASDSAADRQKNEQITAEQKAQEAKDAAEAQAEQAKKEEAALDKDQKTGVPVHEALQKKENEWMRALLERYDEHDVEGNKQLLRGRMQQEGVPNAYDKNW
jgi:hypothetical protein